MKKISEKHCIIFGKHETVEIEIRGTDTLEILKVSAIERSDTLNGHIAFFRAVVNELEDLKEDRRVNGKEYSYTVEYNHPIHRSKVKEKRFGTLAKIERDLKETGVYDWHIY